MSRIWRVSWEGVCYVWAENMREAERTALDAMNQDGDAAGVGAWADPYEPLLEDIDEDWSDALPYGDDPTGEGRSIREVLSGEKERS